MGCNLHKFQFKNDGVAHAARRRQIRRAYSHDISVDRVHCTQAGCPDHRSSTPVKGKQQHRSWGHLIPYPIASGPEPKATYIFNLISKLRKRGTIPSLSTLIFKAWCFVSIGTINFSLHYGKTTAWRSKYR
jgi:hypothetical protein